jgi:proteic killer suppression protein
LFYSAPVIRSYRHKGLKELRRTGTSRRLRQDQVARLLRLLDALNAATAPEHLNVPGFGFHGLHGRPKRYAVSVNGPWRVTFGWDGMDAVDVDLEQYH